MVVVVRAVENEVAGHATAGLVVRINRVRLRGILHGEYDSSRNTAPMAM